MKLSYCAFLVGASLMGIRPVLAQQHTPSEAITAEQKLVENYGTDQFPMTRALLATGDGHNRATLLQTGIGNTGSITQQSFSDLGNQAYVVQAGAANVLGLGQTGGNNNAYIGQKGTGNRSDYLQNGQGNSLNLAQNGSSNQLTGSANGDGNKLNIQQNGASNRVQSEIHQNNRTYTISQNGYGNTLTQKETTSQSPQGYSVEMRGVGINLTIEQGRVK